MSITIKQSEALHLQEEGLSYRQIADQTANTSARSETTRTHHQSDRSTTRNSPDHRERASEKRKATRRGKTSMNMTLPQLSALISGWAVYLHKDIEEYYSGTTTANIVTKQIIEGDIKRVRDAIELLEQELQKIDIFIPDNTEVDNKHDQ